ncbi:MAG: hypothetical protein ACI9N9_000079 [Enterobacterales bacterium]|jgi:hypothetical protein
MEFKGTKIEDADEYSISNLIDEYNIHLNGHCVGQAFNEVDADTFYDSLLVRQKINCSLVELHEQHTELLEALITLKNQFEEMVQDEGIELDEGDVECIDEAKRTINKALS